MLAAYCAAYVSFNDVEVHSAKTCVGARQCFLQAFARHRVDTRCGRRRNDGMTACAQVLDDFTADESRATDHDNPHDVSP